MRELSGLVAQRSRCGSRLLDESGVLLGTLVRLFNGPIHRFNAHRGCSWLAAGISPMMAVTRRRLSTTSIVVLPASPTSGLPASTLITESSINALMSLAAGAERWASPHVLLPLRRSMQGNWSGMRFRQSPR